MIENHFENQSSEQIYKFYEQEIKDFITYPINFDDLEEVEKSGIRHQINVEVTELVEKILRSSLSSAEKKRLISYAELKRDDLLE